MLFQCADGLVVCLEKPLVKGKIGALEGVSGIR